MGGAPRAPHLRDHVPALDLRRGHRLGDAVHRPARDVRGLERLQPLGPSPRAEDRRELGLERGVVVEPRRGAGEALVVDQLLVADGATEARPGGVALGRHDDHLIGGREGLKRGHRGVPGAERPGHITGDEMARPRVLEQRELAVAHGHVDPPGAATAVALEEGRKDIDRGEERRPDVADGDAGARHRAAIGPGDAHQAAHALHHDVEGGARA